MIRDLLKAQADAGETQYQDLKLKDLRDIKPKVEKD